MKIVTRLNNFFDEELRSDVKDILITRDSTGRYTLFGEYSITPNKGNFTVRGKNTKEVFATIKNALAYVTLHNARKYSEARRIQQLDLSLCSVNVELAVHRNILKNKTDYDSRLIYIIKIQEDTIKKRRIVEEIKSHINNSIKIQTSKFASVDRPKFVDR